MALDPHMMLGAALGHQAQAQANAELAAALEQKLMQALAALEQTKLALAVSKAQTGGYKASLDLIKQTSPAIPAFRDSGKRYRDGAIKSVSRMAFEDAHDRIARENRISDPKAYRED